MNRDLIVARLEMVAAKAKQLALDLSAGRLWPGQLQDGLADIAEQVKLAGTEASREGGR